MITELATEPRSYFEERIKYPSLRWQSVLVFLAFAAAIAWRPALFTLVGPTFQYVEEAIYMLTMFDLIVGFVLWAVMTAVMILVGSVLGGEANFGRLLRITGYGFAPLIVGGLVRSAGFYLALQGAAPPDPPDSPGFQQSYAVWQPYLAQAEADPALFGGLFVSGIFLLAGWYLWTEGVRVVMDLETPRPQIVSAVGLLVVLVWWYRPVIL